MKSENNTIWSTYFNQQAPTVVVFSINLLVVYRETLIGYITRIERLFFHTEEGLYTRNVCVKRQFWHFAIIISLVINLIFYLQVSRITKDFLV